MCAKILIIFILIFVNYTVRGELFTSTEYLNQAIRKAQHVVVSLEEYVSQEEARLHKLKKFSSYLSERQRHLLRSPDNIGDNPINVYRFVQLYGDDWEKYVSEYISSTHEKELETILDIKRTHLPSSDDLHGIIDGLVRLQNTYMLSSAEISNGTIQGYNTGKLSTKDCYKLASGMFRQGYLSRSVEWYRTALDKAKQDLYWDDDTLGRNQHCREQDVPHLEDLTVDIPLIESQYDKAKEQFEIQKNNFTQDLDEFLEDFKERMVSESVVNSIKEELQEQHREGKIDFYGKDMVRNMKSRRIYESLCRGEKLSPHVHSESKVCMFDDNGRNPLLILRPVKLEILNPDPYIVMYHDIITEEEMKVFKDDTLKNLERSQGLPPKPKSISDGRDMNERISRLTYLLDDHPMVHKFYNRLQAAIDLKVRYPSAEVLQVANYGFGGQYEPHYDFFGPEQRSIVTEFGSERLVTVLVYLSDVKAGGATVFPTANIYVPPEKGAAAFWLNVDVNLDGDTRTIHAGCPVLLGSKWIANKWVHTHEQDIKCYV